MFPSQRRKTQARRDTEVLAPATAAERGNGANINCGRLHPIDKLYRLYPNDRTSHVLQRTFFAPAVTLDGKLLEYTQMAEVPRKLAHRLWFIGSLGPDGGGAP